MNIVLKPRLQTSESKYNCKTKISNFRLKNIRSLLQTSESKYNCKIKITNFRIKIIFIESRFQTSESGEYRYKTSESGEYRYKTSESFEYNCKNQITIFRVKNIVK